MRPSVRALLAALEGAGPAGLTTGDLARLFDEPASMQRRLSHIGNELRRYQVDGSVTRTPLPERTSPRAGAYAYRWFITAAGSEYLAGGMRGGPAARAREEKAARKQRQAQLIREAAAAYGPGLCKCARDAEIRHLRAEGCVLEAIGAVYGITRERTRQIAAGLDVTPFCKTRHDYAGTPCQHGVVTPAGPEMARRRGKPEMSGRTA